MWPFTSRRIMGNRWWAVAFVIFVCWQAIDLIGETPPTADNAANTTTTDISGAEVDDKDMQNVVDSLKGL